MHKNSALCSRFTDYLHLISIFAFTLIAAAPLNTLVYQGIRFCKTHLNLCLLSILIAVTGFHLLFPDYVQFGSTLTWDGEKYIDYTLHFPEVAFGQTLNVYYFQRIFPSGLIYYSAKLLDIPLTPHIVFYAFVVLNILLIFTSFGVWLLISNQLALSNRGKFLGFIGLFINFAVLKMAFYYPALTDVMAFTLGISLLYLYLKGSAAGVLIIGLVGAFTFPTVLYSSLLLFVFPLRYSQPVYRDNYYVWNRWLALLTGFGFLLLSVVFLFYRQVPLINPNPPVVLAFSIVAVLAYVYFIANHFFRIDFYIQSIRNFTAWRRALVAIIIFIGLYSIILWGAGKEPSPLNYKGFLANILVSAIANPFTFLVAHIVYVGPVILLLIYYSRAFIEQINSYGLGLHVLVVGYLLLSINSETRLFINAWPFFVAFLCKALEKRKLPASFYVVLFLFALSLSKFWYRIEVANFRENYLEFPEQKYFMSIGPWMSDEMYLLQGGMVLIIFLWMYWFYFRKIKAFAKK